MSSERSENNKKINNENIPPIRYDSFNKEWEEKKLKDICVINPKTDVPDIFNYIDLESVNSGILNEIKKINKTDAPSRAQRKLEKKDILFATVRPYQQNNYYFNLDGTYVASTGYAQIRAKENPLYLYYFLHTSQFLKEVMKRCTGTSYPAINSNDLKTINIKIPSILEQEKIASLFSSIDQKIELMETKLKNNDEITNSIRNKIYTDISNPIKCELKDMTNIIKGKQLNKEDMDNTAKYYVLNGGKFPSGYTDEWNVKENTITISEGGESCGYVNYNKEKFYCGGHCYYLELKNEINKYYLFNYLKFREPDIMRLRVGSGLPNIQKKDLLRLKIEIHENNQEKIGILLQLMVNKSLNLKKEIKLYQDFKKSLLNKMFC